VGWTGCIVIIIIHAATPLAFAGVSVASAIAELRRRRGVEARRLAASAA
jgi:hypothetical protein